MLSMPATIYLLCLLASVTCGWLLIRSYVRTRTRLLLWSAICFVFLALNNLLVVLDILVVPSIDLSVVRQLSTLVAVSTLLYGFIWELDQDQPMLTLLNGMITMGFLVAALLFLRFWRKTSDPLFLTFALAFVLLTINQFLIGISLVPNEHLSLVYLFRLSAFALIIFAVVRKNVVGSKTQPMIFITFAALRKFYPAQFCIEETMPIVKLFLCVPEENSIRIDQGGNRLILADHDRAGLLHLVNLDRPVQVEEPT